ncbi:MAG: flagellar biosynthesis protein FlhF, partial [Betaproteobacteria bacterium]
MNIQRFHAPTAREALTQARQTFGEGTLILSNRPTATGVEVVATGEDSLAHMGSAAARSPQAASKETLKNPADKDTEDMAMSTLSFQSYVRERMLRRRKEEASGQASSQPKAQRSQADPAARAAQAGLMKQLPQPVPTPLVTRPATVPPSAGAPTLSSQGIVDELQNMKELIEERFNTMSWLGQARQDPIQSNLMLKLIRSGYSPSMARAMVERLPKSID